MTTVLRLTMALGVIGGVLAPTSDAQAFGRRREVCTQMSYSHQPTYSYSSLQCCPVVESVPVSVDPVLKQLKEIMDKLDAPKSLSGAQGIKQEIDELKKEFEKLRGLLGKDPKSNP